MTRRTACPLSAFSPWALAVILQGGCSHEGGNDGFTVLDSSAAPAADTNSSSESDGSAFNSALRCEVEVEGEEPRIFEAKLLLACRSTEDEQLLLTGSDIRGGEVESLTLRLGPRGGDLWLWSLAHVDDGSDAAVGEARLQWTLESPAGTSRALAIEEGEVELNPSSLCVGTFSARIRAEAPSGENFSLALRDCEFEIPPEAPLR